MTLKVIKRLMKCWLIPRGLKGKGKNVLQLSKNPVGLCPELSSWQIIMGKDYTMVFLVNTNDVDKDVWGTIFSRFEL